MSEYSFWLERIFVNRQLSVHIYDKEGNLSERIGIKNGDGDPFISDPELYNLIWERKRRQSPLLLMTEDGWAAYIALEDRKGNLYIGGPVNVSSDKAGRENIHHYREKHHLTRQYIKLYL